MKKRFAFLVLLALPVMLLAAGEDQWQHANGYAVRVAVDTVDSQYTAYGSWTRACSAGTGATFIVTALDSGSAVFKVSGTWEASPGQRLYVGIDKSEADSTVSDTGYCYASFEAPNFSPPSKITLPFTLVYSESIDSGKGIAGPCATFAAGGQNETPVVSNIVLEAYILADLIN